MTYRNSQKPLPYIQKTTDTRQNCSAQQYLCLRLLMQAIKVKLNVEVAVILDESNLHHLNLPDFEILFFKLPNHFFHFN